MCLNKKILKKRETERKKGNSQKYVRAASQWTKVGLSTNEYEYMSETKKKMPKKITEAGNVNGHYYYDAISIATNKFNCTFEMNNDHTVYSAVEICIAIIR